MSSYTVCKEDRFQTEPDARQDKEKLCIPKKPVIGKCWITVTDANITTTITGLSLSEAAMAAIDRFQVFDGSWAIRKRTPVLASDSRGIAPFVDRQSDARRSEYYM